MVVAAVTAQATPIVPSAVASAQLSPDNGFTSLLLQSITQMSETLTLPSASNLPADGFGPTTISAGAYADASTAAAPSSPPSDATAPSGQPSTDEAVAASKPAATTAAAKATAPTTAAGAPSDDKTAATKKGAHSRKADQAATPDGATASPQAVPLPAAQPATPTTAAGGATPTTDPSTAAPPQAPGLAPAATDAAAAIPAAPTAPTPPDPGTNSSAADRSVQQAAALAQLAGGPTRIKVTPDSSATGPATPSQSVSDLAPSTNVAAAQQTPHQDGGLFDQGSADTGTGSQQSNPQPASSGSMIATPLSGLTTAAANGTTPGSVTSASDPSPAATTATDPQALTPNVSAGLAATAAASAGLSSAASTEDPGPPAATAPITSATAFDGNGQAAAAPVGSLASGAGQAAVQLQTANSPTAAQPVRQPVVPSPAEQIKVQMAKSLKDGNDTITLQLHPEDLGRVEVKLEMQNGQLKASITADRPETLQLLKNDAGGLQQSLHNAGLNADANSLSFHLRGEQQQRQTAQDGGGQNDRHASDTADDNIVAIAAPPAAAFQPTAGTDAGVDIRV